MAFCVRCGKRIPEGIVFCPYCGTNLKEVMSGFEEPVKVAQPVQQGEDFMQERPVVEAQPLPEEQSFMQERPVVESQPLQQPEEAPRQPEMAEEIPSAPTQPSQPPYTAQQPPYGSQPYAGQSYRAPYYTQQEELGYLHQKKQEAPARGKATLGRILGILGMISSIVLMSALLFLCSNYLGGSVRGFLDAFEEQSVLLFLGVFEGIALSLPGVLLSRSAGKQGNPSTTAGKRLGIVGLILSALNLVDLILCLIILWM